LIIQEKIYDKFVKKLVANYKRVAIGNPLDPRTLMGPLIDETAVTDYKNAIKAAKEQGGKVLYGGKVMKPFGSATFVQPTIIEIENKKDIVQNETFAPVLYVMKYKRFDQALKMHNDVPQGLSSAVYTDSVGEGEKFLSYLGSDCGIANINIGTSGAEIGGAFGGEKETGGGRESGSDSWKMYMRRQTNTINWGGEVHLAQGVEFKA
jgi:aldehyde dehydrogenase (NAD+)